MLLNMTTQVLHLTISLPPCSARCHSESRPATSDPAIVNTSPLTVPTPESSPDPKPPEIPPIVKHRRISAATLHQTQECQKDNASSSHVAGLLPKEATKAHLQQQSPVVVVAHNAFMYSTARGGFLPRFSERRPAARGIRSQGALKTRACCHGRGG